MSEPIDHVPAIPELNVSGARHLAEFGEDESSWLSRKGFHGRGQVWMCRSCGSHDVEATSLELTLGSTND